MRTSRPESASLGRRRHHGVAAVEFALVIVILLLALAGVVEFGRTFWYYNALTKATRDGARHLSSVVNTQLLTQAQSGGDATCAPGNATARGLTYCAAISANVPGLALANIEVQCRYGGGWVQCVNGPETSAFPEYVRVRIVNYQVTIGGLIPFVLPSGGGTTSWTASLAPHTTMRHQH